MILAIAIISGILFLAYIMAFNNEQFEHSGNALTYGAICVLSTWYLNQTTGIVFLCIIVAMMFISVVSNEIK